MRNKKQTANQGNIKKAKKWVTSKEGSQYLHQLAKNVENMGHTLIEESQIDISTLRKPVTF